MLKKLILIFKYGEELEEMLKTIKKKKQDQVRELKKHNLNLCLKHKQESNHSHYSSTNCDYCKLQEKYKLAAQSLKLPEN